MTSMKLLRCFTAACVFGGVLAACGERAAAGESAPSSSTEFRVTELALTAAPGSAEPNLTVGPDGRAYLSWVEPAADSAHALRFAVLEGV